MSRKSPRPILTPGGTSHSDPVTKSQNEKRQNKRDPKHNIRMICALHSVSWLTFETVQMWRYPRVPRSALVQ